MKPENAIINKLSIDKIRRNKLRSVIIVLALIMMSSLIAAFLNIGVSIVETERTYLRTESGTGNDYRIVAAEPVQIEELKGLSYIDAESVQEVDEGVTFRFNENFVTRDIAIYLETFGIAQFGDKSKLEKLNGDLDLTEIQYVTKLYNDHASIYGSIHLVAPFILLLIPLIICALLLIYDAFYLTIIAETRETGILIAVGATKKQLHKIVRRHGILLALVGSIVGFIGSIALTYLILPVVMEATYDTDVAIQYTWSFIGFVVSVFFTISFTLVGAQTANVVADEKNVSQALHYSGNEIKKSKSKRLSPLRVYALALANFFRSIKQNLHVTLIFVITASIFLFLNTLLFVFEPDPETKEALSGNDFVIQNRTFQRDYEDLGNVLLARTKGYSKPVFTQEFVTALEQWVDDDETVFPVTASYVDIETNDGLEKALLLGVRSTYPNYYSNKNYDDFSFTRGGSAFADSNGYLPYEIRGYVSNSDQRTVTTHQEEPYDFVYSNAGLIDNYGLWNDIAYDLHGIFVDEDELLNLDPNPMIARIEIREFTGDVLELDAFIQDAFKNPNYVSDYRLVDYSSEFFLHRQVQAAQDLIALLGYTMAFVSLIIAFFESFNLSLISVDQRRREFAILRSMGMRKRDIVRMLIYEGVYSTIFTITILLAFNMLIVRMLLTAYVLPTYNTYFPFDVLAIIGVVVLLIFTLMPILYFRFKKSAPLSEALRED